MAAGLHALAVQVSAVIRVSVGRALTMGSCRLLLAGLPRHQQDFLLNLLLCMCVFACVCVLDWGKFTATPHLFHLLIPRKHSDIRDQKIIWRREQRSLPQHPSHYIGRLQKLSLFLWAHTYKASPQSDLDFRHQYTAKLQLKTEKTTH